MKYLFVLFFCFNGSVFAQKVNAFDKFHVCFERRDFAKLRNALDNKITIANEGTHETYNIDEYLLDMKNWAEVFDTKWNVVSVKKVKDTTYSIEYDTDIFKTYFYDGGNKVHLKYVERNGKLVYLSWDDGEANKEEVFQNRYEKFANWCYQKFPTKYFNLQQQTKAALIETKFMLEEYLKEISRKKST